jgi:glucosamine--fructose-6-phosphate aminotransferase (isomerizing)
MCGIVGYIGNRNAEEIIIEGLKKLEYRGYDSAGISLYRNGNIVTEKQKGRIKVLEEVLKTKNIESTLGIGHTRWATHGAPSNENSHPHVGHNGKITVVHNGIIENYLELKEMLENKGYIFRSETDSEVVAHLIEENDKGCFFDAVKVTIEMLKGAYALAILHKDHPDQMIAVRKASPLIVGLGEHENFIASDIPAILKHTRNIYILEDDEMAVIRKDDIAFYKSNGKPIVKQINTIDWSLEDAEKSGYEHFMLKEIYEQPKAIQDTLNPRLTEDGNLISDKLNFSKEYLEGINKIYIVACGTAYHAGLYGKYLMEKWMKIPVICDVASEFRYSNPFIDDKTLMIVVTQSGETADTLAALRLAKQNKARTLAITNVVGSTISREADEVFYTLAGPEIAVASTKAYTTQIISFSILAANMAKTLGSITLDLYKEIVESLKNLPSLFSHLLNNDEMYKEIAELLFDAKHIFYIGRGIDYDLVREGSLKLKEISYIHSEAMPAGELKHGTIALIERGTPVIAVATEDKLIEKMHSNIKEVKARGAYVVTITKEGSTHMNEVSDKIIEIPTGNSLVLNVLAMLPLQLIAYFVANRLECDIDKPKNLAKSVTVE